MLRSLAGLAMMLPVAAALIAPAMAQVRLGESGFTATGTFALQSDYIWRGISQTRDRPAIQVQNIEIAHGSGLYVGAFVSNVAFLGTNARQEVDILLGYRFDALGISWDVGGAYYAYPGYSAVPGGYALDYAELAIRATREFAPVKLMGSVYYSPNYQLQAGNSLYLEGGIDVTLPYEFVAQARLGYLGMQRNQRYGTPDYAWWSLGVTRPLPGGFAFSLGWYDTNISRADCVGGQKICAGRVLASLTWRF